MMPPAMIPLSIRPARRLCERCGKPFDAAARQWKCAPCICLAQRRAADAAAGPGLHRPDGKCKLTYNNHASTIPMMKVMETLRRAIKTADVSRYAICKATGIDKAALSRFVHGERGLDGSSIEKLADYFGLELLPAPGQRKKVGAK